LFRQWATTSRAKNEPLHFIRRTKFASLITQDPFQLIYSTLLYFSGTFAVMELNFGSLMKGDGEQDFSYPLHDLARKLAVYHPSL